MSGHSKWSTIKRKKEATDKARGALFSKLAKAISVAVKTGGGASPDTNYKLRVAMDQAKAENMPKSNIERAISKGSGGESLEEATYEGFGPEGVAIIVEVATDNRNRTGQEIKNIFERGGGRLAGPGAVSFNFSPKGMIVVPKEKDSETQMLTLIDLGAEDVEEEEGTIEIYVDPAKLGDLRDKLIEKGIKIDSYELVQKPKNLQVVADPKKAERVLGLLEKLEDQDDVQKVFANLNVPSEVLGNIN